MKNDDDNYEQYVVKDLGGSSENLFYFSGET
jgi:hypothetical protein